ncbi:MAG: cation:proton antiporter [Archangium sp.]
MSARTLVVDGLLVLGVGIQWVCALGLLVLRGPFERLHLLGPSSGLGAVALGVAVALDTQATQGGLKALLVMLVLLVTGPVLTHAIGRAATLRERAPRKPEDLPEVEP